MKFQRHFIILLLCFCAINLSAQVQEKKITINFSNIPLSDAMSRIEKATGYTFFYDAAQVNTKQEVSLNSKNEVISKALDRM